MNEQQVEELCHIWELTNEQRKVVDLYAAIHALDFMVRLMTKESDAWFERMRDTVEQWITDIESTKITSS